MQVNPNTVTVASIPHSPTHHQADGSDRKINEETLELNDIIGKMNTAFHPSQNGLENKANKSLARLVGM